MTLQSYENIIRPTRYVIFFALGINKKVVFVNHRPCEPEIPFGPQVPASPVSAVFSVSAVPFRNHSLAKRNGARHRTGEWEKTGGGEDRAVAGSVPATARLFPFLSRARCTIPFGRKWYNGKRKCRQRSARQVLTCTGRNAKRNLLPARARSYAKRNLLPTRA